MSSQLFHRALVDGLGAFAGVIPGLAAWLLVAVPLQISSTCRGALSTIMPASHSLTIVYTAVNPSPVPLPFSLVEKKGSKN